MRQLNVVIIDEEEEARNRFKEYLNQSLRFDCLFAVKSLDKFSQLLSKVKFSVDIVLLEIKGDSAEGYARKIEWLKRLHPNSKVIVFTSVDDHSIVIDCVKYGVDGYLLKSVDKKRFIAQLEGTRAGCASITPKIAELLMREIRGEKKFRDRRKSHFSQRQNDIIHEIIQGKTNQEIAVIMGITIDGVQYHIRQIYKKSNVRNRSEFIRKHLLNTHEKIN